MTIYYKVVTVKPTGIFSFIGEYQKYKIGEFVKRGKHNGPMAVFATVNDTRRFLINNVTPMTRDRHAVFTCHIVKSDEECLYINCGKILPKEYLPVGTVFADEVKLLDRITL